MRLCTAPPALAVAIALALGALSTSCSDDDSAGPDEGPFTGTIRVLDNRFSPDDVTISLGDSVTWRWEGNNSHTVTHGTSPTVPPDDQKLFDSPLQNSGTFGYRFTSAGAFAYFCRPHFSSGMNGTITVEP
jgi:plastocyanin